MSIRPNVQKLRTSTVLAAACAVLFAGNVFSQQGGTAGPGYIPAGYVHDYPTPTPGPWKMQDSPFVERAGQPTILSGTQGAQFGGGYAALGKAGQVVEVARQSLDFFKTLNASDDRLKPDYTPEGAPSVPSKCLENAKCRPCYTLAYEKVNKTRTALEKVRAHYDFTHKFSADGVALMNAVAATAGGPAGIGAAYETQEVNAAVKAFDASVRKKNAELLARLKDDLMEVNTCEAKYYGSNDWYDRFGYMYFQFMSAHYGYAVKHFK